MKDTVYSRQHAIESELSEQKQKMSDLEAATFKHATTVSETLESEIGRFERVISAFEKFIDQQTGDLRAMVQKQVEENKKWRDEYEEVNTRKLLEVHNALKLLNGNIGKVNTDSKDRYDLLQNEVRVLENALHSQLQDLKNKFEVDDSSLEDRVRLAVERVNEKLLTRIDKAVIDYNQLVSDNNKLLTEKFE